MRKIIRDDSTRDTFQRRLMAALAGLHFCVNIMDTVSVTNEQLVSPLINGNVLRMAWPAAWHSLPKKHPSIITTMSLQFLTNFQTTNYLFLWFPSTWEPKSLYDIWSSSRHPQKQQILWYTNTHVHTHICIHGILSHHFVLKFCSGCWCLLSIEEDFVAWEIVCCVHEIVGQEPEVVYLD